MWTIKHGSIASLATVTNPKGREIVVIYYAAGDICAIDEACERDEATHDAIPLEVRGALEARFRRIFQVEDPARREDVIQNMGPVLIGLPQKGERA